MTYDFGVVEQRDSASSTALEQRGSALYGRHDRATAIDWIVDGEQLDTRQEWSQRWLLNVVSKALEKFLLPLPVEPVGVGAVWRIDEDDGARWSTTTLELAGQ